EWQAALESLKTLLTSRPIVYLGFSLRDIDFLHLRDTIANTYKGGIRDHYAVMADVSREETEHWREHYGIPIGSYQTIEGRAGSRDHTPLLALLDSLKPRDARPAQELGFKPRSPQVVLALARYATALTLAKKANPEFQVRVTYDPGTRHARRPGN